LLSRIGCRPALAAIPLAAPAPLPLDLGTSDDDIAARALYERLGFTNREGGPGGPVMYVYERALSPRGRGAGSGQARR
jgi:hypothetical protein